jgi:hypothetical protein
MAFPFPLLDLGIVAWSSIIGLLLVVIMSLSLQRWSRTAGSRSEGDKQGEVPDTTSTPDANENKPAEDDTASIADEVKRDVPAVQTASSTPTEMQHSSESGPSENNSTENVPIQQEDLSVKRLGAPSAEPQHNTSKSAGSRSEGDKQGEVPDTTSTPDANETTPTEMQHSSESGPSENNSTENVPIQQEDLSVKRLAAPSAEPQHNTSKSDTSTTNTSSTASVADEPGHTSGLSCAQSESSPTHPPTDQQHSSEIAATGLSRDSTEIVSTVSGTEEKVSDPPAPQSQPSSTSIPDEQQPGAHGDELKGSMSNPAPVELTTEVGEGSAGNDFMPLPKGDNERPTLPALM